MPDNEHSLKIDDLDANSSNLGISSIEVREGRATNIGRLSIARVLPTKNRRTIGPWCFIDLMQAGDVDEPPPLEIGPHPHIGLATVTWLFCGLSSSPARSYPSVRFSVMATVAIDTRHLGEVPGLCVKTGEPTGTTRQQNFADIPGWTLLLIFWGLIPFLIGAGFARRKITVDLPASEETQRRVRTVDFGAVAGLVVGIGLLITPLMSREAAFAWAGVTVAVITLMAAAGARYVVWVTGRLDGEVLWLYGVHPGFAEEAQALAPPDLAHRLSTRRWVTGLLVAALIALGVLIFLFVPARA